MCIADVQLYFGIYIYFFFSSLKRMYLFMEAPIRCGMGAMGAHVCRKNVVNYEHIKYQYYIITQTRYCSHNLMRIAKNKEASIH